MKFKKLFTFLIMLSFVFSCAIPVDFAFADVNKQYLSNYYPKNSYLVSNSTLFISLARGKSTHGIATFSSKATTVDSDLYSGIHGFSYSKSSSVSRTLALYDIYDFAPGDIYSGIAQTAVNMMYYCEKAGYLTPFYIVVRATV